MTSLYHLSKNNLPFASKINEPIHMSVGKEDCVLDHSAITDYYNNLGTKTPYKSYNSIESGHYLLSDA